MGEEKVFADLDDLGLSVADLGLAGFEDTVFHRAEDWIVLLIFFLSVMSSIQSSRLCILSTHVVER